jgi:hypothetical protein
MAKLFNLSRLGSGANTDIAERSLREENLISRSPNTGDPFYSEESVNTCTKHGNRSKRNTRVMQSFDAPGPFCQSSQLKCLKTAMPIDNL